MWDGQSGACLAVLKGHTVSVDGAQELSDGRLLSWSNDGTLRLWDGQSGVCLAALEGHTSSVWDAEVLSDGRLLSWSKDKTLRLWDGQSGACLEVFPEDQVTRGHPEWLPIIAKARSPRSVVQGFVLVASSRWAVLRHKTLTPVLAAWNADSYTKAQCLLSDGTTVVSEAGFHVCILKLHHGQHGISLAEAETLLPQLYPRR